MSSPTTNDSISAILAKPNKTSHDLQQIIDRWHNDLLQNEKELLQYAKQLDQKQHSLNKTNESLIESQDLLNNLEDNLDQFQLSIQTLTKYNDELENNIEQLHTESRNILPNSLTNLKTEQDRSITYELMESVDQQLNELDQTMKQLNESLQINTDMSIIKTTNDLQTCFHDIQNIEETIKQIKL